MEQLTVNKMVVMLPVTDQAIKEAEEDFELIMGMTREQFGARLAKAAHPLLEELR